ncbi:MAG TPA: hypothetical protein VE714_06545 [Gemmatimonadales bacterium]|jgi:hypothetical protein|nr:hypothetical protein [Gemmatimonadales bacterium]
MTVVVRSDYGWSGEGKSAAEIAADISHTRHRLAVDVGAMLASLLVPRRLVPVVSLALAAASFFLRRNIRRR